MCVCNYVTMQTILSHKHPILVLGNRQKDLLWTPHRKWYHVGGKRGRKVCLFSSSLVLAWGQWCHRDFQVSPSRKESQTHKQMTGAHREIVKQRRGKWMVGWEKRLHPRMSHIFSHSLLQEGKAVGNSGIGEKGIFPFLLHSWKQMKKSTHR